VPSVFLFIVVTTTQTAHLSILQLRKVILVTPATSVWSDSSRSYKTV
jgi:hypothetical protein